MQLVDGFIHHNVLVMRRRDGNIQSSWGYEQPKEEECRRLEWAGLQY